MKRLMCLATLLIASGCHRTEESMVEHTAGATSSYEAPERVLRVAYPLFVTASAHTDATRSLFGITFKDGEGHGVYIDFVHPNMPAAQQDIRNGDRLLAIGGQRTARLNAQATTQMVLRLGLDKIEALDLALVRDGRIKTVRIPAVNASQHSVRIVDDPTIQVSANGFEITLTSGLLNYVDSDPQLAMIIAHEIAHTTLGHTSRMITGSGVQALRPDVSGQVPSHTLSTAARVNSAAQEIDADRVAIRIVRDAGYAAVVASTVWDKLAAAPQQGISVPFVDIHPITPERMQAVLQLLDQTAPWEGSTP